MNLLDHAYTFLIKKRLTSFNPYQSDYLEIQKKILFDIIATASDTQWGTEHQYSSIKTIQDFQERVRPQVYEDIFPYIKRMMEGEADVLWPGITHWFSKSSGTTNARSKFIPVPKISLDDGHFKAGMHEFGMYVTKYPDTQILSGKSLSIGGSYSQVRTNPDIFCGDISAVVMKNLPIWAEYARSPKLDTALMSEWEEKLDKMAEESMKENVTSIVGVPTWTVILIRKVLEKTGKQNIFEVWPNLEVFFHGAVSFAPYKKLFEELIPKPNMHYMEAYNASEGFFAIQDDFSTSGEMLLLCDCGVFYEFIPMSDFGKENPQVLTLADVKVNENYALVITTNGGLARYIIGDTISFTTLSPYRIKITGRTKHCINAFGEEVMVHNTDTAIAYACQMTDAIISEYTVAPVFMEGTHRGRHEWVVEFEREPADLEEFKNILDTTLRSVNSDYDAKRHKDIALAPLALHPVPLGTFYTWMQSRNKLGGQHKVPRLSNSREYVEEILNQTSNV